MMVEGIQGQKMKMKEYNNEKTPGKYSQSILEVWCRGLMGKNLTWSNTELQLNVGDVVYIY